MTSSGRVEARAHSVEAYRYEGDGVDAAGAHCVGAGSVQSRWKRCNRPVPSSSMGASLSPPSLWILLVTG